MYIFCFILFIAMLGITFLFTDLSVFAMFDFVTLLQILLMLIPILIAAKMDKDLLCALRITIKRSASCSIRQLRRCEEAVSLTMKFALCSGILAFLMLLIALFRMVDLTENAWFTILTSNFSTALLSVIYPLFLCCLLLPVHARIRGELINAQDGASEERLL